VQALGEEGRYYPQISMEGIPHRTGRSDPGWVRRTESESPVIIRPSASSVGRCRRAFSVSFAEESDASRASVTVVARSARDAQSSAIRSLVRSARRSSLHPLERQVVAIHFECSRLAAGGGSGQRKPFCELISPLRGPFCRRSVDSPALSERGAKGKPRSRCEPCGFSSATLVLLPRPGYWRLLLLAGFDARAGGARRAPRRGARARGDRNPRLSRRVIFAGERASRSYLLHGFGADKSNWVRVARFLTPEVSRRRPDLPGFGESTRDPNARYGVDDQVERVHAIVRTSVSERFTSAVNSMGGRSPACTQRATAGSEEPVVAGPGLGDVRQAERARSATRARRQSTPRERTPRIRAAARLRVRHPVPRIPRPIERYLAERAVEFRPFNEKVVRRTCRPPRSCWRTSSKGCRRRR